MKKNKKVSKKDRQPIYQSTGTKCNGINENGESTLKSFGGGAFPYVHVVELLVGLLVKPVAAHLPHDLIHPCPSLASLLDLSICCCLVFNFPRIESGSRIWNSSNLSLCFRWKIGIHSRERRSGQGKGTKEREGKAGRAGNLVPSCFRRKQVEIASRFYF